MALLFCLKRLAPPIFTTLAALDMFEELEDQNTPKQISPTISTDQKYSLPRSANPFTYTWPPYTTNNFAAFPNRMQLLRPYWQIQRP